MRDKIKLPSVVHGWIVELIIQEDKRKFPLKRAVFFTGSLFL
jgi:hypothetical protein